MWQVFTFQPADGSAPADPEAPDDLQEFLDKDEEEEEEGTESKVMSFQIKQKEIENVQRRWVRYTWRYKCKVHVDVQE